MDNRGFALNLLETSQIQLYRDLDTSGCRSKTHSANFGAGLLSIHTKGMPVRSINHSRTGVSSTILDADPTNFERLPSLNLRSLVVQGPLVQENRKPLQTSLQRWPPKGNACCLLLRKGCLGWVYQRLCKANLEHMLRVALD